MRTLLVLFSVISFNFMSAQPGGGGQRDGGGQRQGGGMQGGQQRERPEMREFNASEIAGIFNYDDVEALKKLKFKKKNKELQLKVRRAIINYNNKINEIALLNKDNFDTLNVYVNAMMKSRSNNRGQGQSNERGGNMDREDGNSDSKDSMANTKELVEQKLNPARIGVRMAEKKLNKKLESLLDEKKYEKWLKYQQKVKDDLKPEEQSEQNDRSSGMSGGGGRQGGGPPGGGGMR
ncbi:MAG: hypothetical protein ABJK28_08370 [Algibacter sp.]